jgi:hypothetical protein
MSNYTQSTNFATKDSLPTGDPLKIVKGTEINTEFVNISTAISTKLDASAGAITDATINNTTIGATTPSTAAFTTLSASSTTTLSGATTLSGVTTISNAQRPVIDNIKLGYTTTATASGTTTLTVSSTYQQFFTGTSAQTIVLPVTSTLALGMGYCITNKSTTSVLVQSSGGNTILYVPAQSTAVFTCILTSGTTASSWSYTYEGTAYAPYKTFQTVTATVASNALTVSLNPCTLDFRSSTLSSGTTTIRSITSAISVTVSNGSTLGTTSGVESRLAVIAIDNSGSVELAIVNATTYGALDEGLLISTTAEGGVGGADSGTVIYSTSARTSVPFRVVGYIYSTQATAGSWATSPSNIAVSGSKDARVADTVTTITTTQVLNATAGAALGAVGTYAFLVRNSNAAALSAGSTASGSSLVYGSVISVNSYNYNTAVDGASTTSPSGTWRLMGEFAASSDATKGSLWLRIS